MSNVLDKCPVPILQEPWEFEKLVEVYKAHAPKKVLEIGSFYGGTLWYWATYTMGLVRLTSVDYPIGPADGRYEEMKAARDRWPEWTGNKTWVKEFDDIKGDSHDPVIIEQVKRLYPDNDIDFLFIDGDHSYNGVKADYENFAPLVRPGGLIVLHDVYGLPEVNQFWKELKQTERTQTIIGQPGGWGIGIIEKK